MEEHSALAAWMLPPKKCWEAFRGDAAAPADPPVNRSALAAVPARLPHNGSRAGECAALAAVEATLPHGVSSGECSALTAVEARLPTGSAPGEYSAPTVVQGDATGRGVGLVRGE